MRKRSKQILEWIEAFDRLQSMDIKYLEMSLGALDKRLQKKYRQISDKYNEGVTNLINKL